MLSRVSDLQTFSQVTDSVGRLKVRLHEVSEQAGTGVRLNRPSDDPAGAGIVVRSHSALSALSQDQRAVNLARAFLGAQDGVLDDAGNLISRAREIAVQQANGILSDEERAAGAAEVHSLLEAIVALGNSDLDGRRLFSSGEHVVSGAAPFTDPNDPGFDPANPYTGSTTPLEVEIGAGQRIRITTRGDAVFGSAIAAIADLESRLRTGTDPQDALPLLEGAAADISTERASIGGRLQRVDERTARIDRANVITAEVLNATRGADMVGIVSELVELQGQLQVAAAASQRILQASVVNFLQL